MVNRASALDGHYKSGRFGTAGDTGVTLELIRDLNLSQIALWTGTIAEGGVMIGEALGSEPLPGPGRAVEHDGKAALRIEPLKWWLLDINSPQLEAEQGATLDIAHSRTAIRIGGEHAAELLNRLLPLDLRSGSFPVGSVGSSAIHHVGVTLWHSHRDYVLFVPRGFALSVWQVLLESAKQFGVEVI